MTISQVNFATDTFFTWVARTNEVIVLANGLTTGVSNVVNTAITGILFRASSNSAPLQIVNGSPGVANGNVYFVLAISNSVNDLSTANIATANAVNTVHVYARTVLDQANTAYGQANNVFGVANAAYGKANTSSTSADTAGISANTAGTIANAAFAAANTAGTSAGAQANVAYGQANNVFGVANAAYGKANTACTQSDSAGTQANVAYGQANNVFGVANAAYGIANTANSLSLRTGRHTIWLPAGAWTPKSSNGATSGTLSNTGVTLTTLKFNTTTQQYAHVPLTMPNSWNKDNITFIPYWAVANTQSTSNNVTWSLSTKRLGDGSVIDGAFGTAVTVDDLYQNRNAIHVGAESANVITTSAANGDILMLEVSRVTASDNVGLDAHLIGIKVLMTLTGGNDG